MLSHTTDGLERPRLPRRRGVEPSAFTARAAGLYSEVVWDRSWAAPSPRPAPAAGETGHQAAPDE
jgi:hypothetical protein